MWELPTEPTLVGAPVGHPDGSFNMSSPIWGGGNGGGGSGANGNGTSSTVGANGPRSNPNNSSSKIDAGWGSGGGAGGVGGALKQAGQQQQPWNGNGGGGGPMPMKNNAVVNGGWDQGSSSTNSSWGAQVTPQSSQPVSWNTNVGGVAAGGSQWESTSPSGPSSWSQIASKNVQQQQQQQPPPQQQQPPAVRPKTSYDSAVGWGAQSVDQGTPWGGNDPNKQANEWGNGTACWENAPAKDNSWQQQNPAAQKEKMNMNEGGVGGNSAYWKQPQAGNVGNNDRQIRGANQQNPQWNNNENVASGSGWDSLPPASNRSWNPEPATPSNVWTGPPSAQESAVDSSMIWNNPHPKKIAQPDKGTNVWGDPTSNTQNEIKRWKSSAEEGQTAASTPSSGNGGGSGAGGQQQSATSSVWKDSPMAPLGQKSSATAGWNDSPPSGTMGDSSSPSLVNGVGNGPSVQVNNGTIWDAGNAKNSTNSSQWGADNGWTSNKPNSLPLLNKSMSWTGQVPPHRNGMLNNNSTSPSNFLTTPSNNLSQSQAELNQRTSGNSENESSINDDVFSSNPTTPIAHLKNGLSSSNNYVGQIQQPVTKVLQHAAGNPNQLQMLTKQIAEQLKVAVQAGLIDPNVLSNQLPPDAIMRLNHLLQYIPKLEQAQREYKTLTNLQRANPLNPAQAQEIQRVSNEIRQYQTAIQTIKAQINAHTAFSNKSRSSNAGGPNQSGDAMNNSNMSNGESLNQSKLLQWKNGSANGEDGDKKLSVSSPSSANLENLVQNMASLGMSNDNDPWTKKNSGVSDWPQQNDMPKTDMCLNSEKSLNDNQSLKDIDENGSDSNNGDAGAGTKSSTACVTPTNLLDEVPEFRPGQKWLWRDPKEVADDPNATPGSIKPSALITNLSFSSQTSSNMNPMSVGGGLQHQSSSSLFGNVGQSINLQKMNSFEYNKNSLHFNNSDSYLASRVAPGGGRLMSGGGSGSQQQQQASFNRPPLIKQQFSVPNSFVPFNNIGQWIMLTISNVNQIDEHTLQMLVNRMGTTQTYVSPPGSGVALVKFRDVPLERVLSRMQQELGPLGVTIQLMKDSEVERLLAPFNGAQRHPPMFTPNAHGPMAGPPHGMMWDAPPPGPWGPPSAAPPHPFASLPPTPDQMAQLMQQQPPMHDGGGNMNLFGGDRHQF